MGLYALVSGLTTGIGVLSATGDELVTGAPEAATRAALRSSRGTERLHPVVGQALAWDPTLRAVDETHFITRDGRRMSVESAAAGFEVYRIAYEIGEVGNRLGILLSRATTAEDRRLAYRGLLQNNRYRTDHLPTIARNILTALLDSQMQFATALRALSRIYRAADLAITQRPGWAARRRLDLRNIVFVGWWNPFAAEGGRPQRRFLRGPADWERLAIQYMGILQATYPDLIAVSESDQASWVAEAEASQRRIAEAAMMGIPFVQVGIAIGLLIVAVGAAVALVEGVTSVLQWLGVYSPYAEALADSYADCLEKCQNADLTEAERVSWCERCESIATELRAYESSLPKWPRYALAGTAAVGVGYGVHRLAKRRKKA